MERATAEGESIEGHAKIFQITHEVGIKAGRRISILDLRDDGGGRGSERVCARAESDEPRYVTRR